MMYRRWLLLILAVALSIRFTAACVWQNQLARNEQVFRFGDSQSYWILARTIADGTPYQYGSSDAKIFRAPLYPIFLAPFTRLLPDDRGEGYIATLLARFGGCVLGTLSIAWLASLSRRIHSDRAGLLTALAATFYPGAIGMSVFVLSEAVFVPCMVLSVYCLYYACESIRTDREGVAVSNPARSFSSALGFTSGAFSGLGCLARPSWSLWAGLVAVYLVALCWHSKFLRQHVREGVLLWLAFAAGIVIVMSPWWVRNYTITGKWVPTTLQVGGSLYDGWHPGATGSSDEGMEFVNAYIVEQRRIDAKDSELGHSLESTFEWRLDRSLRNAAIQWAYENPSNVLWLGLVKLQKTWSPLPVAKEIGSNTVRYAEGVAYVFIVFLAGIGALVTYRQTNTWLFIAPTLYFAVLHMIFIGSVRYRQPAVLVLCVLAGVGAAAFFQRYAGNAITRTNNT